MRTAILTFFFGAFSASLLGQAGPPPGVTPFSTQSGSRYDSVNLATSNLLINLPIRSKPGTIPFSFSLVGNTGLKSMNGSWYLDSYHYLAPVASAGDLAAHSSSTLQQHTCTEKGQTEAYNHFINVVVIDASGTAHPTTQQVYQAYPCTTTGTLTISPPVGSVFYTTDGSGYTLVLRTVGQFTRPSFTIYDKSGNKVSDDGLNDYSSNVTTNPNGVTVSFATNAEAGRLYTDSYGVQALDYEPLASSTTRTVSYTDSSGAPQTAVLTYSALTWQTAFGCNANPDGPNTLDVPATAGHFLTSISLPDKSSYTFTYEETPGFPANVTGRIAKLGLPNGGSISYAYQGSNNGIYCNTGGIPTLVRTVSDANGNASAWTYVFPAPGSGSAYTTTDVTDPAGNLSVYSFADGYVTQVNSYTGKIASGTPLKTVTTCYNKNFLSCTTPVAIPDPLNPAYSNQPVGQTDVYTSWNGGSPSLVETTYNAASLPTETKQYNFGAAMPPSGNPLVDIVTGYGTWNGSTCTPLGGYIQDHPCTIQVKGPTGAPVSQTNNTYTTTGNLSSQGRLVRGNGYITTGFKYDPNGAVNTITDGRGIATTYTNTLCNNLLPSSIASGGLSQSMAWDCNGGVITSSTDSNNQTTSYAYADPFWRPTGVTYPDHGQTTITYNPSYTTKTVLLQQTPTAESQFTRTNLDGLGRPIKSELTGPDGVSTIDTSYDIMGRLASVSNPYYQGGATTGTVSYNYDALGRKTLQCQQDNGKNTPCLAGTSYLQWSYSNNVSDYYDELRHHWQSVSDSLGRLTIEREPDVNNNPTVETDYTYDGNSNLTRVDQWGGPAGTAGEVARTFSYDDLSRITYACNPEGFNVVANCSTSGPWSAAYAYDQDGNLTSKVDARGTADAISYCYDSLNRLISKSYSGQTCPMTTPDVAFVYDTSSITGNLNTKGRLTSETTLVNGAVWTKRQPYIYDGVGRVKSEQQCTPGNCSTTPYSIAYTYNLAGDISSSTNGVANPGILLTYGYDLADHLNALTSSWDADAQHPADLFCAASGAQNGCPGSGQSGYNAAGQLAFAQVALNAQTQRPAVTMARSYDNRLRPISETDTGQIAGPAVAASASVAISGSESSIAGGGTAKQATATVSLSYTGSAAVRGVHPLYLGSSITLPDGYHVSFVATANSAITVANALAAVLNQTASPVTAVVTAGGTASAASVKLTTKATGADQNGAITLSLATTQVKAAPASLAGGAGATYNTGTVTANINGTAVTTSYGQSSTSQTVAAALATAITNAGAGVNATAGASGALLIAAKVAGTSGNGISVTLSSTTNEPNFFSSASFSGTSASLSGGEAASTTPATVYKYTVANSGGATGYATNSNLLNYSDTVNASNDAWSFSYDNINRLSTGVSSAGEWNKLTLNWTYDPFGNRKTQTPGGSPTGPVPNYPTFSFTNQNHITNYGSNGYDGAGNVINDLINQYLYDAEGRVCAVYNSVSKDYTQYIYDADGERVGKGSATSLSCNPASNGFALKDQYILGLSGEAVSELDGSGNFLRSNVYANGELLATYANNSTYFAFKDWLGSKRVVTNPNGTVAESCVNLPFGDELICSGSDPSAHHFTGQLHDQESGNEYFNARYYSNNEGRFISPDPFGMSLADPTNPQSLNLYGYVLNNPLTNVDPTGLDCVKDNGDGTVTTNTGDCGNEDDAAANAEHYIDCDGCTSGASGANLDAATGSLYLTDASGNGIGGSTVSDFADPQGTSATNVTVNGSAPYLDTSFGYGITPDIDSQRIQQLAQGITNFGIPNVCSLGLNARLGADRASIGADLSTNKGLRRAAGIRVVSLGPVQATLSVKGSTVSTGVNIRIPDTPFGAGVGFAGNRITSANVNARFGIATFQGYAGISNFADPNCR